MVCKKLSGAPKNQDTANHHQSQHAHNLASDWQRGLSVSKRYEWLVDCYRMRVDDECINGGITNGCLYDPDHTKLSVVADFFIFCKLASLRKAIPSQWNWKDFLKVAEGLIPYAFEKSDAQEKYGSENVFSVLTGGRSLRATGEAIYNRSVMDTVNYDGDHQRLQEVVEEIFDSSKVFLEHAKEFEDIGGSNTWSNFYKSLKITN
uniref:Uncharacterized protein n=1 Tax=Arcella intermedia TaxID=1963864 RepID=A0A6B2LH16_9EUKA